MTLFSLKNFSLKLLEININNILFLVIFIRKQVIILHFYQNYLFFHFLGEFPKISESAFFDKVVFYKIFSSPTNQRSGLPTLIL